MIVILFLSSLNITFFSLWKGNKIILKITLKQVWKAFRCVVYIDDITLLIKSEWVGGESVIYL